MRKPFSFPALSFSCYAATTGEGASSTRGNPVPFDVFWTDLAPGTMVSSHLMGP